MLGSPQDELVSIERSNDSAVADTLMFALQIGVFLFALVAGASLAAKSLQYISVISLICACITLAATYQLSGRNIWSFSFVYVFILGLFHFGLTGPYALGLISVDDIYHAQLWWLLPTTPKALVVIMQGFVACGVGVGIGRMFKRRSVTTRNSSIHMDPGPVLILHTGAILVIASVTFWFFSVFSSAGLQGFTASYGDYLSATAGGMMSWVSMGLGIGVSLLAISPPSNIRAIAVGFFVLFSIVALPMGLRGEVMFAAAAATPILAKYRRMPSVRSALVGLVVVLMLISLIREVRQIGLTGVLDGEFSPGVVPGLVELGGTIRPVALVVNWHEHGEPYLEGATYWAPVDRAICQVLHPWDCPPAGEDERLSNVAISNRAGPYGFSPFAEAYRNFGATGVWVVLGAIGFIVSLMNSWARTWERQAFASVVFVELLINVRNAFTAVPSHIVLGGMLIFAIVTVAKYLVRVRPQEQLGTHGNTVEARVMRR